VAFCKKGPSPLSLSLQEIKKSKGTMKKSSSSIRIWETWNFKDWFLIKFPIRISRKYPNCWIVRFLDKRLMLFFLSPFRTIYNSIRVKDKPIRTDQSTDFFELFQSICLSHFRQKNGLRPFCETPRKYQTPVNAKLLGIPKLLDKLKTVVFTHYGSFYNNRRGKISF